MNRKTVLPWTVLFVASLSSVALLAPPAPADGSRAEQLYERGWEDMEAGLFEKACPELRRSYEIEPLPGALHALAKCETKRGHIATGAALLRDYLKLFDGMKADHRAKHAERAAWATEELAKLAPQVPKLTVRLAPGAPPGTEVTRDGETLAQAALGTATPVDPGEHVISARAPGGPATDQHIQIGRGETREVTIEVKPPPVPVTPSAAASTAQAAASTAPAAASTAQADARGPGARQVVAYAAGGVGAAALVVGAVTGALTFVEKGQSGCNFSAEPAICSPAGSGHVDAARRLATAADIGFAAAAVGIGTATVLLLTEPARSRGDATGTAGRAAGARWVGAFVQPAGTTGTVLGLRGAW